MSWYGNFVTD